MAEENVMVELSWNMWCHRHLKPYRANWPEGSAIAMIELFKEAITMPAIEAACGPHPENPDLADARNITKALWRFSPLCCFIGKEALDRIYAKSLPEKRN